MDYQGRTADVTLDEGIFEDPDVPEGCKVFMLFHEIGHLVFGSSENKCDEFARAWAMYMGVSPFLCYVALRAYMPEHYNDRVIEMGETITGNLKWKNDV